MAKNYIILAVCFLFLMNSTTMASSSGKSSKVEDDKNFDVYVEGALTVYSQFKRPSKEESESFYNFLKNRWNASASECTKECAKIGKFEANKYVLIRNIEIRSIENHIKEKQNGY